MTLITTPRVASQQTHAWPQTLAYIAAALCAVASASTNCLYGFAKGSDLSTGLVWLAVSLATSIIFLLAFPALLASINQRKWSQAGVMLLALTLSGAYSVTAALGSASGGRANATIAEQTITDQRAKAQTAYSDAKAELANIKPARPIAELEALLAAPAQWHRGCNVIVQSGRRQTHVCPPNPTLVAELGRAKRRAELEAKIESASAKLESAKPARQANSDSVALAGYLSAIGVHAGADTVNRWLVILSVLAIELGGGLSLAVGMALSASEEPAGRHEARSQVELSTADRITARPARPGSVSPEHEPAKQGEHAPGARDAKRGKHVAEGATLKPASALEKPERDTRDTSARDTGTRVRDTDALPARDTMDETVAGARLLTFLRERGGTVVASQRSLASAMRCSRSHANRVLHELAAAGAVRVTTGKAGTVLRLAA